MKKRMDEIVAQPDHGELICSLGEYIKDRRRGIFELHQRGASGRHTVTALTGLMDEILSHLYREAFRKIEGSETVQSQCSLIAVGGYGRKELAPFSDIDLMFLYDPKAKLGMEEVVKGMLYLLWDLKFIVGHSIRTIQDCIRESQRDITVKTALMEARLIAGSEYLFRQFRETLFKKVVGKQVQSYIQEKVKEKKENFARYGGTVFLLEPDIKKSEGGLREIHYLQWIALARYRTCFLMELHQQGHLSSQEYNALTHSQDLLWRIRVDMHFHAGKCSDFLSFDEQQRLAKVFHFEDQDHQLGVERFMQQYYLSSTRIHDISSKFIERCQGRSRVKQLINRVLNRRLDDLFLLTKTDISVIPPQREAFLKNGENIVKLFYFSKVYGLPVSDETLEWVRQAMEYLPDSFFKTPGVATLFISIMAVPGGIAQTLRTMHQISLLEKIIPEFSRVNRLVQFNQYHKFTIDEHSFYAVEQAENLVKGDGYYLKIYNEIRRKDILHLAILLHDLGKGLGGDHSEKGAEIARGVAERLGYNDGDKSLLVFLVRFHLLMTHIAFRRDLSDEKVLIQFARKIAQPEVLKKMFILTCSDIKAVGPDTWNGWKENLLGELFYKTLEALAGTETVLSERERLSQIKKTVFEKAVSQYEPEWLEKQFEFMTERYLLVTPVERILKDLKMIKHLTPGEVLVDVEDREDRDVMEITVYTFDDIIPGVFSKISGVLAAKGLQILGAQVHTRKNGVVVDTFHVVDPDYLGKPPKERWEDVGVAIQTVLRGVQPVENMFGKRYSSNTRKQVGAMLEPPQIEVDNDSSDDYTILDIFATDRQGLLYVITKAIFELGLSVHSSKIATRLDQIVDVFYIQDLHGKKITDPDRIQEIKKKVISAIEA